MRVNCQPELGATRGPGNSTEFGMSQECFQGISVFMPSSSNWILNWTSEVKGLANKSPAQNPTAAKYNFDCRLQSCPVPTYRVDNSLVQIGQLARAAGVNIQTIRFYEREKLLLAPPRTLSGYRDYSQHDLDSLLFIRRNHEIGFTLAEVRQLLDLHRALETLPRPLRRETAQVKEIIAIGRERLGQINEKICALQMMKRQLEFVVRHLEESAPTTCPVATQDAKVGSSNLSRRKRARVIACPVNPDAPRR